MCKEISYDDLFLEDSKPELKGDQGGAIDRHGQIVPLDRHEEMLTDRTVDEVN